MAKDRIAEVLTDEKHQPLDYMVLRRFKGKELVGKSYEPLFKDRGENAHKVWHADFVHLDEGTGIAHEAPAYGEDDFVLSQDNNVPTVIDTDENGFYTEGEWKGKLVWDVNKEIAKALHERGVVWKIEYITHSYPHCHRCGTRLMYRAHPSWFMDINGQREDMLRQNGEVNWFPEHIKDGMSAKIIEAAPDWNLSRDRFWATPLPVWKGTGKDGKEHIKVVGSYEELKELSGAELEDYHRPWIDEVTFTLDGVEYKRIDKVMDSWFEAGSMPFAQFHYPFENKDKFEATFPGDFIVEYMPQVRAWFYYLNAVNVGLWGSVPFKTALVHGTIAGSDGRKMSKSYGNYTDPNELMDMYSADALRFLFLGSPLLSGEDYSLTDKDVADVHRKLAMVWNMYDFFTMYAEVDGWEWSGELAEPKDPTNVLDQWIVARIHQLTSEVDEHMQRYDIPNALKPVLPFIDDASNWYVRRSRKRFWKSENDDDKTQAYQTLHYVLVKLAHVLAPFVPFMAEELYQKLTGGESVHLNTWPEAGHVNELVVKNMQTVREFINQGLAQRAVAGIKLRQPLAQANVVTNATIETEMQEILKEELNIKNVVISTGTDEKIEIDVTITIKLREEGYIREVIRLVQNARKTARLKVDDRIELGLSTKSPELHSALTAFRQTIQNETLAVSISDSQLDHPETHDIDGHKLTVSLKKAAE